MKLAWLQQGIYTERHGTDRYGIHGNQTCLMFEPLWVKKELRISAVRKVSLQLYFQFLLTTGLQRCLMTKKRNILFHHLCLGCNQIFTMQGQRDRVHLTESAQRDLAVWFGWLLGSIGSYRQKDLVENKHWQ